MAISRKNGENKYFFFARIFFYKNSIFTNYFFIHNHAYWGHFLSYMDLPYHFGKLKMSTLRKFQWFFPKTNLI